MYVGPAENALLSFHSVSLYFLYNCIFSSARNFTVRIIVSSSCNSSDNDSICNIEELIWFKPEIGKNKNSAHNFELTEDNILVKNC